MSDKIKVFVYGTLMKGNHNHGFMDGSEYLGEATMLEHGLYSMPYGFPAIKRVEGRRVKGEVYSVSVSNLVSMDRLEGYNVDNDEGMYLRRRGEIEWENGVTEDVLYYLWNKAIPKGSIYEDNNTKWGVTAYRGSDL